MFQVRRAIARLAKRPAESSDVSAAVRADDLASICAPRRLLCDFIANNCSSGSGSDLVRSLRELLRESGRGIVQVASFAMRFGLQVRAGLLSCLSTAA